MIRNLWLLVIGLVCFVMITLLGYVQWQDTVSVVISSDSTTSSVETPPLGSAPIGNGSDSEPTRKPLLKSKGISHTIHAKNSSIWTCTAIPAIKARSNEWQVVTKNTTYIYSAYLDQRFTDSTLVRVFGIISDDGFGEDDFIRRRYYCMAWRTDDLVAMVTEGSLVLIGRNRSRYSAVQFQCHYDVGVDDFATASIVTEECSSPNNALKITNIVRTRAERDFTVCLSGPLKHMYANANQFVEWMELNQLLGAELFYIYDYSVGRELMAYLKYYQSRGLLKLLPWKLPFSVEFDPVNGSEFDTFRKLWNYGQEVLIPDCLYRNMYKSRFVVFEDLDELIVPRQRDPITWSEMIRTSECKHKSTAAYVARNVFFNPESEIETPAAAAADYRSILDMNQRQDYVYQVNSRSKYIAFPDRVIIPYIHKILYTMDEHEVCSLAPETALLHHYRIPNNRKTEIADHTLDKYKEKVLSQIQLVRERVMAEYKK